VNKEEKISIKVKVGAKKIWAGIGLIALGVFVALFIGYFFFIGGQI
jgi:uncharacterized membrane protein YukC